MANNKIPRPIVNNGKLVNEIYHTRLKTRTPTIGEFSWADLGYYSTEAPKQCHKRKKFFYISNKLILFYI